MKITPQIIKQINKSLQYGDKIKIAEMTGLEVETVRFCFKGYTVNDTVRQVLTAASDIIAERKKAEIKIAKKIA